jgi:hypothetical protein
MKKEFTKEKLPSFPSRSILLFGNEDDEFIENRRYQLDIFFRDLLTNPKIHKSKVMFEVRFD